MAKGSVKPAAAVAARAAARRAALIRKLKKDLLRDGYAVVRPEASHKLVQPRQTAARQASLCVSLQATTDKSTPRSEWCTRYDPKRHKLATRASDGLFYAPNPMTMILMGSKAEDAAYQKAVAAGIAPDDVPRRFQTSVTKKVEALFGRTPNTSDVRRLKLTREWAADVLKEAYPLVPFCTVEQTVLLSKAGNKDQRLHADAIFSSKSWREAFRRGMGSKLDDPAPLGCIFFPRKGRLNLWPGGARAIVRIMTEKGFKPRARGWSSVSKAVAGGSYMFFSQHSPHSGHSFPTDHIRSHVFFDIDGLEVR